MPFADGMDGRADRRLVAVELDVPDDVTVLLVAGVEGDGERCAASRLGVFEDEPQRGAVRHFRWATMRRPSCFSSGLSPCRVSSHPSLTMWAPSVPDAPILRATRNATERRSGPGGIPSLEPTQGISASTGGRLPGRRPSSAGAW